MIAKSTPKINEMNNNKNKNDKNMNKLATFNKLPPSIPAKSPKEVKEILKYFKKNNKVNKKANNKKYQRKLYSQASTPINNTRKVLKIKETFPNLQAKKIKKIVNSKDKPKPKLNMMIKELSRKQVIIPMSIDNKTKFMKDSSMHIANINRVLKNIKSKAMADFV